MSLSTPQASPVPLYAGFWRRAAAWCLDSLVLVIPGIAVNATFGASSAIGVLIDVAIACAYFAGFHSSAKQATPGKMAFGIKVSTIAGERMGIARGVGRYFASWLSAIILMIGFLMAAFTQKRQALHDVLAGTLVVNANADPGEVVTGGGVMQVTAGVWVIVILLFIAPFVGGILAAIAIPAYLDYTMRAKVAEVLTATTGLRSEIQQVYAQKQPFRTGSIQVASPSVKSAEVDSNGVISVRLVPGVAGGGRIVYTPSVDNAGTMSWQCSAEGVPPRYLPASCRQ